MNENTSDRTLSAWLKKDEKSIIKGIKDGFDLFELGFDLDREPVSILRHMNEMNIFPCDLGSEEETEFFGLAFSGVPIDQAILWCVADKDRSTDIESLMKIGDMRPALYFARDHGISVDKVDCMDDLCWVMDQSQEAVSAALNSIDHAFDIATPRTMREHMNGVSDILKKDLAFPPLMKRQVGKITFKKKTVTRARKSTSTARTWKPRRATRTGRSRRYA